MLPVLASSGSTTMSPLAIIRARIQVCTMIETARAPWQSECLLWLKVKDDIDVGWTTSMTAMATSVWSAERLTLKHHVSFFQSSILIVCCIHNNIFATSYPQKKETSVVLLYLKLGNRHCTYLPSFSRQMVHSNFHRNLSSLHQLLLITACTVIKSRYIISPWSAISS